jgi:hypothetical protein
MLGGKDLLQRLICIEARPVGVIVICARVGRVVAGFDEPDEAQVSGLAQRGGVKSSGWWGLRAEGRGQEKQKTK